MSFHSFAFAEEQKNNILSTTDKITEKNWTQHPALEENRKLYEEVNRSIKSGKFKLQSREFACGGPGEKERQMATDEQGALRFYSFSTNNENFEYYYDAKGVLRFLFHRSNTGDKKIWEERAYFNDQTQLIWSVTNNPIGFIFNTDGTKTVDKQKWNEGSTLEEWDFIKNPKQTFEAAALCHEISKGKSLLPQAQSTNSLVKVELSWRSVELPQDEKVHGHEYGPRTRIYLVIREGPQIREAIVGTYSASCGFREDGGFAEGYPKEKSVLMSGSCWWAGSGAKLLVVRKSGDTIVIKEQKVDEMTDSTPFETVNTVHIPKGSKIDII